MRIFGIDPGSVRTGFGCVESDGSRHRLVRCGAITAPARLPFPNASITSTPRSSSSSPSAGPTPSPSNRCSTP